QLIRNLGLFLNYNHKKKLVLSKNSHSERSDECIDFTMNITSQNNASISKFGGNIRWQNDYSWRIEVKNVNATIFVPEEIPSLLSVVYSNMPPIKKGTDSKLGVGFRLGPNADVQFQLELGPQTNTLPIGGAASAPAVANKRHATVGQGSGLSGGKPKDWLNAWRLQMSPGYVADESNNAVSGEVAGG
ncbi:Uncharacterized protein FWK35_00009258, partial [Aphis craccivora]